MPVPLVPCKNESTFLLVVNWTFSDEFIYVFFTWKIREFDQISKTGRKITWKPRLWFKRVAVFTWFWVQFCTSLKVVQNSRCFHVICDHFRTTLSHVFHKILRPVMGHLDWYKTGPKGRVVHMILQNCSVIQKKFPAFL